MDDLNASDCSWKKIVLSKSQNEWVSMNKCEALDTNQSMNTYNISSGDVEECNVSNVKQERNNDMEKVYLPNVDDNNFVNESNDLLLGERKSKRTARRRSGLKHESNEERAERLARMSAYATRRLANETPEQRAARLKRMSEYSAKRLATESKEQRARRLSRMSAYAARRLANETIEQREARLARMSAYAARRQALKKASVSNTDNTTDISETF